MAAWNALLQDASCSEQLPDEFTWKRHCSTGYVVECLDVSVHNLGVVDRLEHQPTCAVCRYVPHIEASDHVPIELEFVRRRRRKIQGQLKAPPHIPAWLYHNGIFQKDLQQAVEDWYGSRAPGMKGLCEFAELVQLVAKDCMGGRIFIAESPDHKFDVIAAALRSSVRCSGEHVNMQALCFRKAARFCNIVPALEAAITWDLDLQDGTVLLDVSVAREQLRALHSEIVAQHATEAAEPQDSDQNYGTSLQTGSCRPYTLQRIKEHLPKTMHHVVKLRDQDAADFAYDEARIAELLTADARVRQGAARGGEDLLRHATLNLRDMRSNVHDDEILNAILDGNASASPGPNGVRGHPYHAYASLLIPVFREAFNEIVTGSESLPPFTEGLLRPIGKTANPCTFKQIRDLELPNFHR